MVDPKLLFLMIQIIVLCFACKNDLKEKILFSNITDYYILNPKGKVKTMSIKYYNAKDSLLESNRYKFNSRRETIEREFKKNGNHRKEFEEYNSNGTMIKMEIYNNEILMNREITTDSLNENGLVVKKSTYDINGNLIWLINYDYTAEGEINSIKTQNLDNGEFSKWAYYYENKMIKKNQFFQFDKDSTQIKNINKNYDFNGNLILNEMYFGKENLNYREVFKYNTQNRLVEHLYFSSDTSFYWKRNITYDKQGIKVDSICQFYWSPNPDKEKIKVHEEEIHVFNIDGNIIQQIFTDKDRDIIKSKIELKYSENGLLLEEMITHPGEQIIIRKFDSNENKILEQVFDNNNVIKTQESYRIEYDYKKNVTKQIKFKNGEIQKTVRLHYEYY